MSTQGTEGPGRVPPPVLYLAGLVSGVVLNGLWPISLVQNALGYALGSVLVLLSIGIIVPVIRRYRGAKTPFDVRKTSTTLITDGPNRFSRNPGYVALTMIYLGIALFLNNAWVMLAVVPIFIVMDRWVVPNEEGHLAKVYGEEYAEYKASVRRWL